MANKEQLAILRQGVDVWNKWREENSDTRIDLSDADLHEANLEKFNLGETDPHRANYKRFHPVDLDGVNLNGAYLGRAYLRGAFLRKADLRNAHFISAQLMYVNFEGADLRGAVLEKATVFRANFREARLNGAHLRDANLSNADCNKADFSEADLRNTTLYEIKLQGVNLWHAGLGGARLHKANLSSANLNGAFLNDADLSNTDFRESDLRGADLRGANLTEANLEGANIIGANLCLSKLVKTRINKAKLSGVSVYGISVWDLIGDSEEQNDLIISDVGEPIITVDNIKIAQFVYLLLNNKEIRDVINTLTSKSVLILGQFAIPERKAILDALRAKLREFDLLPIVFDFDRPTDKDFTETIKTLAGLSYFVIADVTNPKSAPLELQSTIPDYQIHFVPIIQEGEKPFAMMVDLQKKYNWVLNTVSYDSEETLMKVLKPLIIDPAMKKRQELRIIKAQEPEIISAKDFLAKGKE